MTVIGCVVPKGHKRHEAHLSSFYAIDAPPVVGTSYIIYEASLYRLKSSLRIKTLDKTAPYP